MYMNAYVHMGAIANRGQKRVTDHLELELQADVNLPTWMLGTDVRYSTRAVSALIR